MRTPWSTSRLTFSAAATGVGVPPGYSPASTRPGSTHQAWSRPRRPPRRRRRGAGGEPSQRPAGDRRACGQAERADALAQDDRSATGGMPATTPAGAGELAGDGGGGVGVVAEVGGAQDGVPEVGAAADRPERGLEGVDAVAGTADRRRLLAAPRPARDRVDGRVELAPRQNDGSSTSSAGALDERGDHRAHAPGTRRRAGSAAWVVRLDSPERSAASRDVGVPADRHGGEAHQRAVGGRLLRSGSGRSARRCAGTAEQVPAVVSPMSKQRPVDDR